MTNLVRQYKSRTCTLLGSSDFRLLKLWLLTIALIIWSHNSLPVFASHTSTNPSKELETIKSLFPDNAMQLIPSLVVIVMVSSGTVITPLSEIDGVKANWCFQCVPTGNCWYQVDNAEMYKCGVDFAAGLRLLTIALIVWSCNMTEDEKKGLLGMQQTEMKKEEDFWNRGLPWLQPLLPYLLPSV